MGWAFQHIEEIMPTAVVPRTNAANPQSNSCSATSMAFVELGGHAQLQLKCLQLPAWIGAANAEEYLDPIHTDAFLVIHKRKVLCEQYFGEQNADRAHIVQSISKTF